MKHKIITYNAAEEKLLSQLRTLRELDTSKRDEFVKFPGLPLQYIQKICAEAFECETSDLVGKINHNYWPDKSKKIFFMCACYYFSNEEITAIAKYVGCQRATATGTRDHIYHWIAFKNQRSITYLNIVKALILKCPGRLESIAALQAKSHERNYDEIVNKQLEASKEQVKMSQKLLEQVKNLQTNIVIPSLLLCFECPFNKNCKIKDQGIMLCPQIMKLTNLTVGPGQYWRYKEKCLQAEKIRLN